MEPLVQCPECQGTGEVHSHNPICWECHGTGKTTLEKAQKCIELSERIRIAFPPRTGDYE